MILLDTHVWWWCLSEPEKLSNSALEIIKETKPEQRAIASISIWEFVMMASRKKIEIKITLEEWLFNALEKTGMRTFEITPKIAVDACNLPGNFHKDTADRIIIATARANNMTLVTKDEKILSYPYAITIW